MKPINWIFLKISWDICVLDVIRKKELEQFLIECHDVFAKHRFEVSYNTELKSKLTPELPVYVQGPPAPIHLRDEILIELALLENFIFTTKFSCSKNNLSDICSWQIIW